MGSGLKHRFVLFRPKEGQAGKIYWACTNVGCVATVAMPRSWWILMVTHTPNVGIMEGTLGDFPICPREEAE